MTDENRELSSEANYLKGDISQNRNNSITFSFYSRIFDPKFVDHLIQFFLQTHVGYMNFEFEEIKSPEQ